jgi:hypothetical protein
VDSPFFSSTFFVPGRSATLRALLYSFISPTFSGPSIFKNFAAQADSKTNNAKINPIWRKDDPSLINFYC